MHVCIVSSSALALTIFPVVEMLVDGLGIKGATGLLIAYEMAIRTVSRRTSSLLMAMPACWKKI